MDKKKLILYIQSALCILWVMLMAAAAIHIYLEGYTYQAQGHPEVWIYTREKAAAVFGRYLPVLLLAVAANIAAVVIGARDENQDKPVADPELISLYKSERETASSDKNNSVNDKKLNILRLVLFAFAVLFVIAGVFNGSMEDMLIKAVNICTECIGLG